MPITKTQGPSPQVNAAAERQMTNGTQEMICKLSIKGELVYRHLQNLYLSGMTSALIDLKLKLLDICD